MEIKTKIPFKKDKKKAISVKKKEEIVNSPIESAPFTVDELIKLSATELTNSESRNLAYKNKFTKNSNNKTSSLHPSEIIKKRNEELAKMPLHNDLEGD